MKRFIMILFVATLGLATLGAQQAITEAIIRELAGTVELKRPNSDVWEAAIQGTILTEDTVISTGFRSTALIALGNSFLNVRPLTRLTLMEIRSLDVNEVLNVNLQTGRVRVDVHPPAGGRTTLNVTSPMAIAGARGTTFEFDTLALEVNKGTVEFEGAIGPAYLVDAGRSSRVDEISQRASSPIHKATEQKPELPIASEPIKILPRPPETSSQSIYSPPSDPASDPSSDPSGTPGNPGSFQFAPDIQF